VTYTVNRADMETLAAYPPGEWVFFADDDGTPLPFEHADPLSMERIVLGYVETAVGKLGVLGPTYHRLTEKGRQFLQEQADDHA
jgi:hypothetical protein